MGRYGTSGSTVASVVVSGRVINLHSTGGLHFGDLGVQSVVGLHGRVDVEQKAMAAGFTGADRNPLIGQGTDVGPCESCFEQPCSVTVIVDRDRDFQQAPLVSVCWSRRSRDPGVRRRPSIEPECGAAWDAADPASHRWRAVPTAAAR